MDGTTGVARRVRRGQEGSQDKQLDVGPATDQNARANAPGCGNVVSEFTVIHISQISPRLLSTHLRRDRETSARVPGEKGRRNGGNVVLVTYLEKSMRNVVTIGASIGQTESDLVFKRKSLIALPSSIIASVW